VTKAVPAGWAEERQASPGNHRPGWRCVGRRAIAKDSGRQTCCVAEANAGGRGSDDGVGGESVEQAKVIAEHGAVAVLQLQEAADVGQIGGRKSAAAAEGVDWRRRRGKVRATTRCG
jgi:hypothetical protein